MVEVTGSYLARFIDFCQNLRAAMLIVKFESFKNRTKF